MIEALIAALLALPNTDLAATPERAPMVAQAIADASGGDARLGALLVSVGFHESRFVDRIQAGQCRRYECDSFVLPSGEVRFRARSFFQLHRHAAASGDEWRRTTGLATENVSTAAAVAARVLSKGLRACGSSPGAVAYYATGRCRWSGARSRVALAQRVERRLRAAAQGSTVDKVASQ